MNPPYKKYTDEEIIHAVDDLIKKGYIIEKTKGIYIFRREIFFKLKNHFRLSIFFRFENVMNQIFILALVFLLIFIGGKIFEKINPDKSFIRIGTSSISSTKEFSNKELSNKIILLENKFADLDSLVYKLDELPLNLRISKEIISIKEDLTNTKQSINKLNNLISDDPSRVLEISSLQNKLNTHIRITEDNMQSIYRELDRVSSYNNTMIILVISFLTTMLTINYFYLKFLRKRKVESY